MQITLTKLIQLIGLRNTGNLTVPRLMNIKDFTYPKDTSILWHDNIPSSSIPILNNINKPVFYVVPYMTNNGIGKYKKGTLSYNKVVTNHKAIEDNVEYTLKSSYLMQVNKTRDILLDYSELNNLYVYQTSKDKRLATLRNPLQTMVEDVVNNNYIMRLEFLPLEVPKILPKYDDVLKMLKYNNYKIGALLKDDKFYPHLELIRYFFKEYREDSVFNIFPDIRMSTLNILICSNGGVTLLQPAQLFSMSKDVDITYPKFNKVDPKTLVKMYLKYLMNIQRLTAIPLEDLNKGKVNDAIDDPDPDGKDIDADIEKHNIENAEIEPVESVDIETASISMEETQKEIASDSLSMLKDRGVISVNSLKDSKELIDGNIEDMDKLKLTDKDVVKKQTVAHATSVIDKSMLNMSTRTMDKYYIENVLERHINRSVLSLCKAGLPVKEYDEEIKDNLANRRKTMTMSIKQPSGTIVKAVLHIPIMSNSGVMLVNGNEYKLTKQRVDTPIKKTRLTEVVLTSFYGKLFLRRANAANNNLSKYLTKILLKHSEDPESNVNLYVTGVSEVLDIKLPYIYTTLGRNTRSFMYGDIYFLFSHLERDTLLTKDVKLHDLENNKVLVGVNNKHLYFIDMDNNLIETDLYGKDENNLGDYLNYIGIYNTPYEYIVIKILGTTIPIMVLLMYYKGINKTLALLGVKYRFQTDKRNILEDEFFLRFEDGYLVLNRDDYKATMVVGSLKMYEKALKDISFRLLNNRDTVKDLMSMKGVDTRVAYEMECLKSMFIGPMTEDVLKEMKEPTTFIPLILRACELLKDDQLPDPRDMSTFIFKGSERLAGMVYNTLCKSVREHYHKLGRVRTKFTVDPYAVYKALSADATFNLVEDLNPIEAMKQDEETTMLGMFGRTSETITVKDREYHSSMVGVLSEATKDNANVGITTYLSSDPRIANNLGMVEKNPQDLTPTNVYSTSLLNAPGGLNDDGKRVLYISIQNGHIVSGKDYTVLPYRSGEESVIPYKVGVKSALHATEKGKVLTVSKNKVVIQYKDKKKTYKLNSWTGKEEGGKTTEHKIVTNLMQGDTVDIGDNIYYDSEFFAEDVFNRNRVCYKSGLLARVALTEAEDSFEDSSNITTSLAKRLTTPIVYVKDKILTFDAVFEEIKRVGDKVTYNDNLLLYRFDSGGNTPAHMSKEGKELLDDMTANKLKAEAKGVITAVEIYYNMPDEYSEELPIISKSMKQFIQEFDKVMVDKYGKSANVDSSFSIKGKGLMPGNIFIKYYISKEAAMYSGDKFRIGYQLKSTIANIYGSITTESGRVLEAELGLRGLGARIVESPFIVGESCLILEKIQEDFIKDLGI